MTKGKKFVIGIVLIILGGLLTFGANLIYSDWQNQIEELTQAKNELQKQYDDLANQFQANEESKILIAFWVEQDGYDNPEEWWNDVTNYRSGYLNCDTKVIEGDNAEYVTEEQKEELHEIAAAIYKSRSPAELKELVERFNRIVEDIEAQKNEALYQEYVATTNAYSWNSGGYNNYDISSDGLTPQSGVNYYDGRTETYYSSNVLYHYRTNEWSVDSEGFYRTDDGYYVVAASDMEQGTTFKGSKGTCIVLDSGCSEGVTDYYVAW